MNEIISKVIAMLQQKDRTILKQAGVSLCIYSNFDRYKLNLPDYILKPSGNNIVIEIVDKVNNLTYKVEDDKLHFQIKFLAIYLTGIYQESEGYRYWSNEDKYSKTEYDLLISKLHLNTIKRTAKSAYQSLIDYSNFVISKYLQ